MTKLSYKIGFWFVLILTISGITAFSYKYADFVGEKLLIIQNMIIPNIEMGGEILLSTFTL
jgi:hypothetical protein